MKKRGQLFEIISVVIVISIAIFGASTVYYQKDLMYVGDIDNLTAYKYSDCKEFINSLPQERIIVFPSLNEIPTTYNVTSCCD